MTVLGSPDEPTTELEQRKVIRGILNWAESRLLIKPSTSQEMSEDELIKDIATDEFTPLDYQVKKAMKHLVLLGVLSDVHYPWQSSSNTYQVFGLDIHRVREESKNNAEAIKQLLKKSKVLIPVSSRNTPKFVKNTIVYNSNEAIDISPANAAVLGILFDDAQICLGAEVNRRGSSYSLGDIARICHITTEAAIKRIQRINSNFRSNSLPFEIEKTRGDEYRLKLNLTSDN